MKERPILFSAPMVRAILEGRKTQTRRVMKPQPTEPAQAYPSGVEQPYPLPMIGVGSGPYGYIGDKLWVRETWRVEAWSDIDNNLQIGYAAGGNWDRSDVIPAQYDPDGEMFCKLAAQSEEDAIKRGFDSADGDIDAQSWTWSEKEIPTRWRPSIHMPRWASRLTLEIISVRVQRIKEISLKDMEAEGVTFEQLHPRDDGGWLHPCDEIRAMHAFQELWDGINYSRGFGLEANPWVWVIEFKRVTR